MKRVIALTCLMLVAIVLTGCPAQNGSQLQQAATASENAAIIMQGFENAEITAHTQGLIPDADHQFIQKEVATVAALGKTTDSCIATAGTSTGAVSCLSTAITEIDQINSDGGLYLKSASAKQDFSLAMTGIKTVLVSIETMLGTTPAVTPVPVTQ